MIEGARILVTGATGQVAMPIVRALAGGNTVFALGRLRDGGARSALESLGVRLLVADLASGEPIEVPEGLDYVLNFANSKSAAGDFDRDLAANVEGLGRLMAACRGVKAFLHCSSAGVYQEAGDRLLRESDPLGDNHRNLFPTYSICKIAAEAMVRFAARQWGIPSIVTRLSVPYGANGGWPAFHLEMILAGSPIPVHPNGPSLYNPIHEDDYVSHVPRLLEAASIPATTVNWGGSRPVALEEWCRYLGELVGRKPQFIESELALSSVALDTTKMESIVGPTRVEWREGMRRMVAARHPEIEIA